MSTPVITPQPPAQSLPPRLRQGDSLNFQMQTTLDEGATVFLVLSAVINNVPVRQLIGATQANPASAIGGFDVTTDINSVATFAVPAATTDTWAPGRYDWAAFTLDSSTPPNRNQIATGVIRITPDIAGVALVDTRTKNEKMLAAIQCLLAKKVLDDAQMYKVGNRELTGYTFKELGILESVYEQRVRSERMRRGDYVRTSTIGIQFGGRGCR
jgi:hypothetical protein